MIIAGEREHNQTTLEIVEESSGDTYLYVMRHRDAVGGGTYVRDSMGLVISDDRRLRLKMIHDLAVALDLGVKFEERHGELEVYL